MFRALVLVVAAATVGLVAVGLVAVGLVGGQHSAEAQQTASATRIPDANIIIMLRDPVERAYSHYSLLAIYGHERKPFYQALLDDQARHGKLLNQYQGGMCISGRLTMTERTPRHLISPLGPNWVGTDSAV